METLRLNRTMSCPDCCYAVKPFVIGRVGEDRNGRKMVAVKCPRPECEAIFQAFEERESDNGL